MNKDSQLSIAKALENEFTEIAKNVTVKKNKIKAGQIKTSAWNYGNRKDTTSIRIVENANKDGYVIEAETCYKKTISFYFWDYLFFSIGVVFCFVAHAIPWLLLFFIGWHCFCRFMEYRIYSKDETNMKNLINRSLNQAKQIVENDLNRETR